MPLLPENPGEPFATEDPIAGRSDAIADKDILARFACEQDRPWWRTWINREMVFWYHLSAASAQLAALQQNRPHSDGLKTPKSGKTDWASMRMAYLEQQVKLDPSTFDENWDEIQRFLYQSLQAGDNNFARNLANHHKAAKSSSDKLEEAMKRAADSNDWSALDREWREHSDRQLEGYRSRGDMHLVRNWADTGSSRLPPFCCWKDEAMGEFYASKAGNSKPWPKKHFEDRRRALGLLKFPIVIVETWNDGRPILNRKVPDESADRIKAVCKNITPEIFEMAFLQFPKSRIAHTAVEYFLQLDNQHGSLSRATRDLLYRNL